jgi:hypothetical protein
VATVRPYPPGIAQIEARCQRVTREVTAGVARGARRRCPIDTGELESTIREEHLGLVGRVWVGTDHWAPTEYGSRPHEIRSHGPYPLRNRETGEIFGPVVWHPGTPSQPFMRPALYQRRVIGRAS